MWRLYLWRETLWSYQLPHAGSLLLKLLIPACYILLYGDRITNQGLFPRRNLWLAGICSFSIKRFLINIDYVLRYLDNQLDKSNKDIKIEVKKYWKST